MTTELIDKKAGSSTPAQMINNAIASGADLEKLEKLLSLQERWEANEAKKTYHKAMTAFKANPPEILKTKKVAYGNTKYNHATLSEVTNKINDELSKHGLSASWSVKQNGAVSVTCKITHEQGHSEETTLTAPADKSGSKNDIQAIGSTISYLERYSLLALTGLATEEMDDDGNSVSKEKISLEEANAIRDNLIALEASEDKFVAYMGIDSIENMLKSDIPKANNALENVKKKKESKK